MGEPVKSIVTPIRLSYDFTPGVAAAKFLHGLANRKILGGACPECKAVIVPPRGSCPQCAVATEEVVQVSDHGTIVTFSIVRVPSDNLDFELPYACISVLLDGAGLPFFHVVQGCDLDDVHMGMRVKAEWVEDDQLETSISSIKCFAPSGEPDADYETYKVHA